MATFSGFYKGKPVVRCSSLDQLLGCPGSRTVNAVIAAAGGKRLDESESWEGNWCHFTAAQRFIADYGAMPPEGGLPPAKIPANYQPEGFAHWIVDFFVRTVMEATPGDWAMEVEREMLVEFPRFWLSGHVDVDGVNADATELNYDDLKSGKEPVDMAEANWQVLGYGVLFKCDYPQLKKLRGRIIQPCLTEAEGQRVSAVVMNEEGTYDGDGNLVSKCTINNVVPFLESKINAALDAPMELNSGVKQCRWCPAALTLQCPLLKLEAQHMKMTLTTEALEQMKAQPDDSLLAFWVVMRKHLSSKFNNAQKLAKARIEERGGAALVCEDGSVKLIDTMGDREFADPKAVGGAWEIISENLDPERAYECITIRVGETEKQLAAQFGLSLESKKADKETGKTKFAALLGNFVTRKPSKELTVVV